MCGFPRQSRNSCTTRLFLPAHAQTKVPSVLPINTEHEKIIQKEIRVHFHARNTCEINSLLANVTKTGTFTTLQVRRPKLRELTSQKIETLLCILGFHYANMQ